MWIKLIGSHDICVLQPSSVGSYNHNWLSCNTPEKIYLFSIAEAIWKNEEEMKWLETPSIWRFDVLFCGGLSSAYDMMCKWDNFGSNPPEDASGSWRFMGIPYYKCNNPIILGVVVPRYIRMTIDGKKSCTTWDLLKKPWWMIWLNYQPQLLIAGFFHQQFSS